MTREELERMTLDQLYRLALERGVREAPGLPREAVLERLLASPGAIDPPPEHRPGGPPDPASAAADGPKPATPDAPAPGIKEQQLASSRVPAGTAAQHAAHEMPPRANEPISRGERPRKPRPSPRGASVPSNVAPDRPSEHDPEDMAWLYLDQGEPKRAAEIFRELLAVRPGDEQLLVGLSQAEKALGEPPADEPPPRPNHDHGEPMGMLDLEEAPDTYGVDECEVIAQNPHSLFVYWEVTDRGLNGARGDLGEEGHAARLTLRIFATAGPGERGPDRDFREFRDHVLDWNHGRRYMPAPRSNARVRAAVGLLTPSGLFAPIAHSSQVRVPPAEPGTQVASDWLEVAPARTRGLSPEPIRALPRGTGSGERALFGPNASGGAGGAGGAASGGRAGGGGDAWGQPTPGSSPLRWRPGSQG